MQTSVNSSAARPSPTSATTPALKEWAIALQSLLRGETILLLRKGGIRERQGRFTVEQTRLLLYPTYEHQKPHLLKPTYAEQVQPVASGWHPATVSLAAWADITHIFQITTESAVQSLLPFHVWNQQLATERLHWKPRQPLYVLLLRVHPVLPVQVIPYRPEYGGCQSWIQLDLDPAQIDFAAPPVLDDETYDRQVKRIAEQIQSASE